MFTSRLFHKVSKNATITTLTIIAASYLLLNVLSRSRTNNPPILHADKQYWNSTGQRRVNEVKFHTKILPYTVNPVIEEDLLQGFVGGNNWAGGFTQRMSILRERRVEASGIPVIIQDARSPSEVLYLYRSPPEEVIQRGSSRRSWRRSRDRLTAPGDYFRYLHTPQFWCRKLVMLGGTLACSTAHEANPEDGNKLVCLDPPLELPGGRDPRSCLVFSFGISTDSTFDEGVSRLPCEVHMFDVMPTKPSTLLAAARHAHFHVSGLADHHVMTYVQDVNKTVEFNNVAGFLQDKGLAGRPLHVLKIDIEETEWDVLKQLAKEPILDIVGQIAMEVHVMKVLKLPPSEQLNLLQDRYQILRDIEKRGFRSVSYWDNRQPRLVYQDPQGQVFDTCGEILYVNTNWYNDSFRRRLKHVGFKFRGV
ncbi:uncharacterized protein LOC122251377 [Penaeus japonicus]|uniref:uncharacterized protein LOC122251377 n=1 Tax=Penaeus japonicus TaxID=27405 RepID=UPI001C71188F|nr:uncharacterized protein LOC122251377 [Penaeus japonicus]